MNVRKYQNNFRKKNNLKKISYMHTQNTNSSIQQMNSSKLNNSQPLNNLKSLNDCIIKGKGKKRIQINIYSKPFKLTNGINTVKNNIRHNYLTKLTKTKNKDFSLMNISNDFYNTLDLGRNAINNIINLKNEKKIKTKEKTPFKNKLNTNQDNKENFHTNIIKVKQKLIYKTKTSNNLKTDKTTKANKILSNNIKTNTNYNNIHNLFFHRSNNFLKPSNTTKEDINNISLRLFKKVTIASKNKTKKAMLYTPKKNLNANRKYSKLRSKTVQQSAKKLVKDLLTSQNSQSRFYINKILSPE